VQYWAPGINEEIGRSGTQRSGLVSEDVSIADPQLAQFQFSDPDEIASLVVQAG
jgi:hypothetical protein